MPKKITIELTEKQARTVLKAVEEYFRLRMGQCSQTAEGLAFCGYKPKGNDHRDFDRRLARRGAIVEVLKAAVKIAFPDYDKPEAVPPEIHIASDIWGQLRWELSTKEEWMSAPFQMGTEPLPKITVEDDGDE